MLALPAIRVPPSLVRGFREAVLQARANSERSHAAKREELLSDATRARVRRQEQYGMPDALGQRAASGQRREAHRGGATSAFSL